MRSFVAQQARSFRMTSRQELRFGVGGGFGEIFPGDEDEVLVFKEFLEFLAFDEVEVVLTPLDAPVGVIEGRALDFGVVIGEMNDELIGASGKRLQHFLVGVEPFGLWNSGCICRTPSRTMHWDRGRASRDADRARGGREVCRI